MQHIYKNNYLIIQERSKKVTVKFVAGQVGGINRLDVRIVASESEHEVSMHMPVHSRNLVSPMYRETNRLNNWSLKERQI